MLDNQVQIIDLYQCYAGGATVEGKHRLYRAPQAVFLTMFSFPKGISFESQVISKETFDSNVAPRVRIFGPLFQPPGSESINLTETFLENV
jgi:hypothetical protein